MADLDGNGAQSPGQPPGAEVLAWCDPAAIAIPAKLFPALLAEVGAALAPLVAADGRSA
jgi:hypothetical protein